MPRRLRRAFGAEPKVGKFLSRYGVLSASGFPYHPLSTVMRTENTVLSSGSPPGGS